MIETRKPITLRDCLGKLEEQDRKWDNVVRSPRVDETRRDLRVFCGRLQDQLVAEHARETWETRETRETPTSRSRVRDVQLKLALEELNVKDEAERCRDLAAQAFAPLRKLVEDLMDWPLRNPGFKAATLGDSAGGDRTRLSIANGADTFVVCTEWSPDAGSVVFRLRQGLAGQLLVATYEEAESELLRVLARVLAPIDPPESP